MWISKKRWLEMEKRIADLESKVQSQQKINPCPYRIGHHESLAEMAAQSALKDLDSLTFQVNPGNRRLFEQTVEPKC